MGVPVIVRSHIVLLAAVLVVRGVASAAFVEMEPDGRAFVYRMREGDTPADVARGFGLPEADVPAWLAAQGVTDGTRVPTGFALRVENPLAPQVDALAAEVARQATVVADATRRADAAEAWLRDARAVVAGDAARRETLSALSWRWRVAQAALLLLVVALAAAVGVLVGARREAARATRWARGLAAELDDRRRAALAERQQAARRVVDLEQRLRELEAVRPAPSPARVIGRPG